MTLLDDTTSAAPTDERADERRDADRRPDVTPAEATTTIDLTDETVRTAHASPRPDLLTEADPPVAAEAHPTGEQEPADSPFVDPSGRLPLRGMRIRRVRLGSVALVAAVFFALGFAVVVATMVATWSIIQSLGFVADFEDLMVTSLGLESFEIDGSRLFTLVAIGAAALAAIGWLLTVMLAAVYNATCAVFGGVAVETGPLQRRRRVFSLRHRGFVTVRA